MGNIYCKDRGVGGGSIEGIEIKIMGSSFGHLLAMEVVLNKINGKKLLENNTYE